MVKALILAGALALAACQTPSGDWCDLNEPRRHSEEVIAAMDIEELRALVVHNEFGSKACHWTP